MPEFAFTCFQNDLTLQAILFTDPCAVSKAKNKPQIITSILVVTRRFQHALKESILFLYNSLVECGGKKKLSDTLLSIEIRFWSKENIDNFLVTHMFFFVKKISIIRTCLMLITKSQS